MNIFKLLKNKFTKTFNKDLEQKIEQKIEQEPKKEINLDLKFYFSTSVKREGLNIIFHKAIDRDGKIVWIDKSSFPEEDLSFYLIIINSLREALNEDVLISRSFNLFHNRQEFYSKYTFIKKIKK